MYNFKQSQQVPTRSKEVPDKQRQPSYQPNLASQDSWDLPALNPRQQQDKPRPHLQHQQQQQQLVPLMGERGDSGGSEPGDERLRGVETRLRVAEKSNRALLEEVVRLQSELKAVSRRGEDALREERRARQLLEGALRSSGEAVSQLTQRIRAQEDRLTEERGRVDSLAETAGARKEAQGGRLAALERELDGLEKARAHAERTSDRLLEEVRALRARVEQQQQQEPHHLQQQQQPKRGRHASAGGGEEATAASIDELRRLLTDLRARVRSEADERRHLEQRLLARVSELTAGAPDSQQAAVTSERLALQARIHEASEALNQRILEKEVRLREDAARSQAEAERLILREQEARLTQEREARHQQEQRWEALRKMQEDELGGARRAQRAELAEAAEATRGLQDAVQQLERRLQEHAAEAAGHWRRIKDDSAAAGPAQLLAGRVQELESRLASSSAAFASEIGALAQRINKATPASPDKAQLESLLEDYRRETGKRVAGTEEQLQALKTRLDRQDERLGGRLSEGNETAMRDTLERLEAISHRLGQAEGHVIDLKAKHAATNDGVHRNSEQITALMEDLRLRVGLEIAGRVQDTDSIRMELERLRVPSVAAAGGRYIRRELDECQARMRKLAEVVQTVKTVLGMKIQAEQTLRLTESKGIQEEMKQQKGRLDQLSKKAGGAEGKK